MGYAPLLHRVQHRLSAIELVHTPHPRWPLPALPSTPTPPAVHVSVLDSSFNPPTLAHLALANTPPPPSSTAQGPPHVHACHARLLLLSVRNADKLPKPGDATYEQRIDMMVALARDLNRPSPPHAHEPNVAVAIIDEPTFVGKSPVLLAFLAHRIAAQGLAPPVALPPAPDSPPPVTPPPAPRLTFLMGTDTLVRLFAPRYYPSEPAMRAALRTFLSPAPDGDDCALVCARRVIPSLGGPRATAEEEEERRVEEEMAELAREVVSAPAPKLAFVDIGERVCAYSSSEVRERVARGDAGWRDMVAPSVAEYITANGLYSART
ncbi:hypothetical protein C8Q78DRAFT_1189019 [Trametes maxima]|nr:hypothetical protein C8Q78DRAFT_1189019 [Trametes maxima]